MNAAAYTHVDQAEVEQALCRQINALAVQKIAEACQRMGCPLVQVSTDFVFGNDKSRDVPYREEDTPAPVNVYGQAKLAGERSAARHERHFIVRTCGLYASPFHGSRSRNFVSTMLRLAKDCKSLRIVADQHCTPIYVPHVARAIRFLLSTKDYGTYHVVQAGATTWYGFARAIFRILSVPAEVQPISSAEYPTRARRPAYSVLDGWKHRTQGGPPMPHWQEALEECLSSQQKYKIP